MASPCFDNPDGRPGKIEIMNYETIADVYSANQKIREAFTSAVTSISADEATVRPDDEKWTIQEIVEHVSMVDNGAARICAKLLEGARAANKPSDGTLKISPDFGGKSVAIADIRVEAPERVHPTGNVTIDEAVAAMEANISAFDKMRPDLERLDLSDHKFPHPFFGDMTAAEWLIVAGGHEMRHLKQIEKVLEKVRQ